jgi:hypothetical protein
LVVDQRGSDDYQQEPANECKWIFPMTLRKLIRDGLVTVTVFLAFVLTAFAGEKGILHIEIRVPKTAEHDTATYVAFGTNNKIEFDALTSMNQREDGEFKVFKNSYGLHSGDQRHAIIIYVNREPRNQLEQVFLLSTPRIPKPMDWTNWQYPNYVETNAVSNFRFNYTPLDRSTNAPPDSFELRYSIE